MKIGDIQDCRLYYKDDDNNYIPITELKEVTITESDAIESVDITPYKKFNNYGAVSFTVELTPEAANVLFRVLGGEILNYQINKIQNAINISLKQVACALEESLYDDTHELLDRELDYDTKLKKYDKFSKSQMNQFRSPAYHNKNYPYRRCDRSR